MKYPGGDIPPHIGVCSDMPVRALRAIGLDPQKEIYEDRKRCPKAYGGGRIDANIDHRRCKNQIIWMKRHAVTLTTKTDEASIPQWEPGDLIYWDLDGKGLLHVGIVSILKDVDGMPFMIENGGVYPYATEAPLHREWKILYHFRVKVKAPAVKADPPQGRPLFYSGI